MRNFHMRNFHTSIFFAVAVGLLLLGMMGLFYLLQIGARTQNIRHESQDSQKAAVAGDRVGEQGEPGNKAGNLTGMSCKNSARRPIAVLLAEDREARPLSGIGFADVVIEMPVVTGSVTRMLAIYACEDPQEIGSVRSARHDFVFLAQGYDAILAHWGGSHFALDELEKGGVDNLDAMPNHFDAFYRKKDIEQPHNGFTSMEKLLYAAKMLGYRLTTRFEGYGFLRTTTDNSQLLRPSEAFGEGGTIDKKETFLEIGYKYPYNVKYEYNPETNSYRRWRGGTKEVDKLTGKQVETKNVVVMRAKSRQIGGGYNDVDVLGTGEAAVYRNGIEVTGSWKKEKAEDVLRFYDVSGEEIAFTPGKIWIQIVEPNTVVR